MMSFYWAKIDGIRFDYAVFDMSSKLNGARQASAKSTAIRIHVLYRRHRFKSMLTPICGKNYIEAMLKIFLYCGFHYTKHCVKRLIH